RKLSAAKGPVAVILPLRGVSALDGEGQPFDDPQARTSLFDAIRSTAGNAEIAELNYHINDRKFAEAAARKLLAMLNARA
ncbi:MAG: Tm-1-like ATP-binding domain-containing protein, partial [Pirellulales bacterium]